MKSSSVKDKGSVFMGRSYGVCLAIDTRIGASLFMSRAKAQPSSRSRREYAGSGGCALNISAFKTRLSCLMASQLRARPVTYSRVLNIERTSCISGAEVESTPSALLIRRCGTIKRRGSK